MASCETNCPRTSRFHGLVHTIELLGCKSEHYFVLTPIGKQSAVQYKNLSTAESSIPAAGKVSGSRCLPRRSQGAPHRGLL